MAVAENVERVYPTRIELEQESRTNVKCPIVGCLKIFQQPSALRFHLVKLHKLVLSESDARLARHLKPQTKKQCEYYCPESGCRFSGREQKFFQSYKKLKQHYMRLHAQRSLVCSICDEKFGLGYDLTRHVSRCRQKPWCLSCKVCMGSLESLAQHLRETGHTAMTGQCSEDICDAEMLDQGSPETCHVRLSPEGSDSTEVCQASNAKNEMKMLKDSGSNTERGIVESDEKIKTIDASDQLITHMNITSSAEVKLSGNLLSSSDDRNQDAAEKRSHEKISSKPKDDGSFSQKKKKGFGKSERTATPRTILPAPNFVVIPSSVGAVLFYGVPIQPSDSTLKRLAPRPSSSLMELDTPGVGRILPAAEGCLVADARKRDIWTACSAHDLKLLETVRESVSTQTRSRKIRVAETQTTEGYVLKKTLGICNSPLSTLSCGSQVSPRARGKRLNRDVQSTHTQTSRSLARRRKPNISDQMTRERVSSAIPSVPPSDGWPDFTHNETQTMALLQQLQASFAENSSTQTLESYLFDNFPNENCIIASSSEMCTNPCDTVDMLQDSVYRTIGREDSDLFSSVMLPIADEQAKEGMNSENNSNTNQSDYAMFSSEFPNIMDQNRSSAQCSGFLIHDEMFVKSDFNSSAANRRNEDLLNERKTFTAETQTMHPDSLADFLTAASQTNDFDDTMSINTETQTVDDDDLFTQFWSHMETQTTDEFLTEFGFSDIETQTTWMFGEDVLPLGVAAGIPPQVPQRSTVLLDMQTQTCFQ